MNTNLASVQYHIGNRLTGVLLVMLQPTVYTKQSATLYSQPFNPGKNHSYQTYRKDPKPTKFEGSTNKTTMSSKNAIIPINC